MPKDAIKDKSKLTILKQEILEELAMNEVDEFDKDSYNMILEKASELEHFLSVEKFNLVFIGQKGVGKTTAISNLFNLLVERNVQAKISGKGKNKKIIEELLETGAGGTTICDVILNQSLSEVTQIAIEPYSSNDALNEIETFCNIVWKKRMSEYEHFEDTRTFYLASEVERAIRNMTELVVVKEVDKAIQRAKDYVEFEDFKNEVVRLASIDNRITTKFIYENSHEAIESEAEWIKSTFKDINLVKFPDILIPRKVTISLSKNILDFDSLPRIQSIIDTRGLDSQSSFDRKDLEQYIREGIENLCIITDSFPPSPSEPVFNLFKRYLYDESLKDLSAKMILLILHKKDEAANVLSYNDKVENEEEGIIVRKREIENKFLSEKIPVITENIMFFNSMFGIEDKKIKVSEDEIEEYESIEAAKLAKINEINENRKSILNLLGELIEKREQGWLNELEILIQEFKSIKFNFENDIYAEEHLNRIKEEIFALKNANGDYKALFSNVYLKKLGSIHPSTLAAINRSYGIFSSHDIYYLGSVTIEEIYKEQFKKMKDQIISKIDTIRQFHNMTIKTKTFFNRLYDKVNKEFDNSMRELNESIYRLLNIQIFATDESENILFWKNAKTRWGQGTGYKEDIQSMYKTHLQSDISYTEIDSLVETYWSRFINIVLTAGSKN
ncbi:hypothetical protein [Cohnella hashimotonis]|uniref:G domain-containing protein n=1 Tax=Cohnella hashimotonis TaxID=2826895 RepID=A0ABT6TM35_9BACL|nr:hypothetical protein [Cohnella hashimotonis]MDI4647876.1 hypothetical protein [Cohnella hashimotonis]